MPSRKVEWTRCLRCGVGEVVGVVNQISHYDYRMYYDSMSFSDCLLQEDRRSLKIGNQRGIIVSDGPEYTVVYWTGTVVNASQESLAEYENP